MNPEDNSGKDPPNTPAQGSARGSSSPQPEKRPRRDGSDPRKRGFLPQSLDKSIIAIPLLDMLDDEDEYKAGKWPEGKKDPKLGPFEVIIDLNLNYADAGAGARQRVLALLDEIKKTGRVRRDRQKEDRPRDPVHLRRGLREGDP